MARVSTDVYRRAVLIAATLALAAGMLLGIGVPTTSAADEADEVGSVTGSAFGYWAEVSLFGGPASERGPAPVVELASDASNSPTRAEVDEGAAVFGPATVFRGAEMEVRTEGTLGPGGSVTTSARVQADLEADRGQPQRRPGPLYYDVLESSCTVDENGEVSGTTTVTGGEVVTSYHPLTQLPETQEDVPEEPEPNYTVEGTIDHVGDNWRIVYNEQIENEDGSLTVNAAHMYLLGAIAVGDLIIGQSICGVSATPAADLPNPVAGTPPDSDDADDTDEADDPDAADETDDPDDSEGANGGGVPLSAVGLGLGALVVIAIVVGLMLARRGKAPPEEAG